MWNASGKTVPDLARNRGNHSIRARENSRPGMPPLRATQSRLGHDVVTVGSRGRRRDGRLGRAWRGRMRARSSLRWSTSLFAVNVIADEARFE